MFYRRLKTLALAAAALSFAGGAQAATIEVTIATDDPEASPCTLRDAISAANTDSAVGGCDAGSGDDEIVFPTGLAGETITLINTGAGEDGNASGDLDVNDPDGDRLIITGPTEGDPSSIVIDGNETDRVFDAYSELALRYLTVQEGEVHTPDASVSTGGGIRTDDGVRLSLRSCLIRENEVRADSSTAQGGGVFAAGPTSVTECEIIGNSVLNHGPSLVAGGGVALSTDTGESNTIVRTQVSENTVRSQVNDTGSGGFGDPGGGGLYLSGAGASGTVTIAESEFSENITQSDNATASGAGLESRVNTVIVNSTFSRNKANAASGSAARGAGVLFNDLGAGHTMTLNNVTIANNMALGSPAAGGGINVIEGTVRTANTLIADNSAASAPDCIQRPPDGVFESSGFNLVGDDTGCAFPGMASDQIGTAATGPIDAMLAPLADNGGFSRTHALNAGSPAVDMGNVVASEGTDAGAAFPECGTRDQRGGSRAADGDSSGTAECDIGAFERAATPSSPGSDGDSGGGGGGCALAGNGSPFDPLLWLLAVTAGLSLWHRGQRAR